MKATIQVKVEAEIDDTTARVLRLLPIGLIGVVVNALIREYSGQLPKDLPLRVSGVEVENVIIGPTISDGRS
jgi:hypothetical protein